MAALQIEACALREHLTYLKKEDDLPFYTKTRPERLSSRPVIVIEHSGEAALVTDRPAAIGDSGIRHDENVADDLEQQIGQTAQHRFLFGRYESNLCRKRPIDRPPPLF